MGWAGGHETAAGSSRLWLFAIEGVVQRAQAAESRAARQVIRMVVSEAVAVEASRIRRLGFNTLRFTATGRSSPFSFAQTRRCRYWVGHFRREDAAVSDTTEARPGLSIEPSEDSPMTATHPQWTVLPHGKLTELDDGILTVVGEIRMPLMKLPRRMTVVRLSDGRLVIWSAIALDETEMASLERYGVPTFLVVPNDHHRLDAKAWKDRYPMLQVVAPEGAREKVAEAVPVDGSMPAFDDPNVLFVVVPGTRGHEAALLVRRAGGTTLVLNDLVGNIRNESGFGGWLLRLMGFAGETAHIPAPVKLTLVKDTEALRTQLLQWAGIPSLRRIVVSHGATIDEQPQQTLLDLAASLK
jgi:hypothetical protein